MECIIAEKPSVARDIARVVGANGRGDGYLEGNGYLVTHALGHLVELESPEAYGYAARGRAEDLPIVPDPFRLRVGHTRDAKTGAWVPDDGYRRQLDIIRACFERADALIVATDAGREGELIFRYIYEFLGCDKPFRRLWISSLTDGAISEGMAHLRDGHDYDGLAAAARARSQSDWLVGMNASRALAIAAGFGSYSLGRVQTPTLAFICRRHIARRDFQARDYYRVEATFDCGGAGITLRSAARFDARAAAEAAAGALAGATATVADCQRGARRENPPLLHDLTSLQREANRRYGLSASETLACAQRLYEAKLTTYPRTGSRYIPEDVLATAPGLIASLAGHPRLGAAARAMDDRKPSTGSVDAARVTDHHALLVTGQPPQGLSETDQRVYELIAARMLEAFAQPATHDTLRATITAGDLEFRLSASVLVDPGWRAVEGGDDTREGDGEGGEEDPALGAIPDIRDGDRPAVTRAQLHAAQTQPKPDFTDDSLLAAMERAGGELEDAQEKAALKGVGIGTPATRAATIERLVQRGYIARKGRKLQPTDKGLSVFGVVQSMRIADAGLSASWEIALAAIERGEMSPGEFARGIQGYVAGIVGELLAAKVAGEDLRPCPKCQGKTLRVAPRFAKCTDPGCGLFLWREVAGHALTDRELGALLAKGRVGPIKRLKSKVGREFEAELVLSPEGKIHFQFPADSQGKGRPAQGKR